MTDIVEKLRRVDPHQVLIGAPPYDTDYLALGRICHGAAAEIERLRAAVLAEREACAKVAEQFGWSGECRHVGAAIRARGEYVPDA